VTNPSADIADLGFVTEQEKLDAYAAAEIFCQPSLNESFSYVIMEAWLCGTPCLVHEKCEVTRDHAVSSGGGLYFNTPADFSRSLGLMLNDSDLKQRMSTAGREYVLDNFAWKHIVTKFKEKVFTK
jgi:glycosyltransferase involved in cell wall biosynthesis